MDPHPDFAAAEFPRNASLDGFLLTPLNMEVVDEDYDVVMDSADVLDVFGDWPAGLTREGNLIDMAWHDREFTSNRSFCWVIRDPEGVYLGCAYLFPELGARGAAEVVTWIRKRPDRDAVSDSFLSVFQPWLTALVPGHVSLTWRR